MAIGQSRTLVQEVCGLMEKAAPEVNKVLILENKREQRIPGYEHAFSFCSNEADSFTHDYLTKEHNELIYEQEFSSILKYLKNPEIRNQFSYRGVDLLWCFKKVLFEFVYFLRHRYETLKKVIAAHPHSDFWISRRSEFFDYPSLAQVIPVSSLKNDSRIKFFEEPNLPSNQRNGAGAKQRYDSFWPDRLAIGNYKEREIAVFSDFEKSKSVVRNLKKGSCVLFLNTKSPRMFFRALTSRSAVYQIAFDSAARHSYETRSEAFIRILQAGSFFSDFQVGDIQVGPILRNEIGRLFRAALPKLLFEIDQIHDFFSRAKDLRSVLVDEDVSPVKNAFCQLARHYSLESFLECHGALGHKIGLLPLTADFILMWGQAQKEKLVRWGCPENRVLVSGCSRYRQYQLLSDELIKKKVTHQLALDPLKKTLLLAFISCTINRGHFVFEAEVKQNIAKTLRAIADLVIQDPALQIILKVHPGDENFSCLKNWGETEEFGGRVKVIERFDPLLLAKAADFMVVYASTYAVEGFALNKPVICLYDSSWLLLEEFRPHSAFLYANDENQLREISRKILANGYTYPASWTKAKRECLNEKGIPAEEIIASLLVSDTRNKNCLKENLMVKA